MNYVFIIIPAVCYVLQGCINVRQGDNPHAIVWFAYALGNIGFLWHEMTKS